MGSWMAAGERKSRFGRPTVSLEWGGAARSVSPHGMQISCVRRGVRWAVLSSVTGVGPKNQHFPDFRALDFAVPGPRSARFHKLDGLRVGWYIFSESRE